MNPRTMFFAGSMRSVRKISFRSPASASISRGQLRHGVGRGVSGKGVGVGPEGRGEPRRPVEVATQHLTHRFDVLARPPGGVEADRNRSERCAERFGDAVGEHADRARTAERRVREVRDDQVGTRGAHHPRHERERVVLHQHGVARRRVPDHRIGEGLVDGDVRVPRDRERLVERRVADQVEEAVEEEPQDLVGDDLVVELVHMRGRARRRRTSVASVRLLRAVEHGTITFAQRGRDAARAVEHVAGRGERRAACRRGHRVHGWRRWFRLPRSRTGTVLGGRRSITDAAR